MYRAMLWVFFDNAEDARMEIGYGGVNRVGKYIYHTSNRVHITNEGTKPCSWQNFSDRGFPPDMRRRKEYAHALGSAARTDVPARSKILDAPRPSGGCYDDICD